MKLTIEDVRSRFIKHFDGSTGNVYASPGRINLIGEHTDYNNGYVFPGAVEQGMIAELKANGTRNVRAYSIDLKDKVEFSLDDEKGPKATWARYIYGVCREMMALGVPVQGFNTAFAGDVPLGAGMSSSAALESTFAFALNDMTTRLTAWNLPRWVSAPNTSISAATAASWIRQFHASARLVISCVWTAVLARLPTSPGIPRATS